MCIRDSYDTRLAENGWYKSASDVVKLLVDVMQVNTTLQLLKFTYETQHVLLIYL